MKGGAVAHNEEVYPMTTPYVLCVAKSSHVGCLTGSSLTILKADTLEMIQSNFGSQGED